MSPQEAQVALQAGADLIGLVSDMPDGPGVISLAQISKIVASLPPDARTVLLTSKTTAIEIYEQQKLVNTWGVQVVDHIHPDEMLELKKLLPSRRIFGVVHVVDESSLDIARSYFDRVDHILLDSGSPDLQQGSLGGTGQTHDWNLSRQICMESPVPVFLAGGISQANLSLAFFSVSPSGFDLCSSLRTDGDLDIEKVANFMTEFNKLESKDRGVIG